MNDKKLLRIFIVILYMLIAIMLFAAVKILPELVDFSKTTYAEIAFLAKPVTILVLISGIPFFIVLFDTIKLCKYILENKIYTNYPLMSLNRISISSILISILFLVIMILFLMNNYFTPLLGIILFLAILSSLIIGIIGKIFSILIKEATIIKLDNDLTI